MSKNHFLHGMDGKAIESTLDLVIPEADHVFVRILRIALYPLCVLHTAATKLSGEEKWQRAQYRRMVDDRPPMSSDQFLSSIDADVDPRMLLAVRHAFSQATGVPVEYIHPSDNFIDVGRLSLLGFDIHDIMFRVEKISDMKVLSQGIRSSFAVGQPEAIAQFAVMVARHSRTV